MATPFFLDTGKWRVRLFSVLPTLVTIFSWFVVYRGLGYGAAHSGMYLEPGEDPFRFLRAVIERSPLLLWGQCFFPSELHLFLSSTARKLFWLLALGAGCLLFIILFSSAQTRPYRPILGIWNGAVSHSCLRDNARRSIAIPCWCRRDGAPRAVFVRAMDERGLGPEINGLESAGEACFRNTLVRPPRFRSTLVCWRRQRKWGSSGKLWNEWRTVCPQIPRCLTRL